MGGPYEVYGLVDSLYGCEGGVRVRVRVRGEEQRGE
jgi:hypothetical protein